VQEERICDQEELTEEAETVAVLWVEQGATAGRSLD
jgi:hypothetical protein